MSALVTGGAGFIGSHLVTQLVSNGQETHVLDNLSSGKMASLQAIQNHPSFKFQFKDLLKDAVVIPENCKTVYHLAANPEVRISATNPDIHFSQNVVATFNMLEAARRGDVDTLVFTSSSTVYGDAKSVPTPEDYSPLEPISIYGASKLACESIMVSYAHAYGIRVIIYRLANIIGEDSNHGVIYDFVNKLLRDQSHLEILGDGSQNKSYLYISDCISAMLTGVAMARKKVNVFNVGSQDRVDVSEIATAVIEEMGLVNTRLSLTGGVDNGRGWKGDVKNMLLDISRMASLGWEPQYNSREAVRLTAKRTVERLVYPRK